MLHLWILRGVVRKVLNELRIDAPDLVGEQLISGICSGFCGLSLNKLAAWFSFCFSCVADALKFF